MEPWTDALGWAGLPHTLDKLSSGQYQLFLFYSIYMLFCCTGQKQEIFRHEAAPPFLPCLL